MTDFFSLSREDLDLCERIVAYRDLILLLQFSFKIIR